MYDKECFAVYNNVLTDAEQEAEKKKAPVLIPTKCRRGWKREA